MDSILVYTENKTGTIYFIINNNEMTFNIHNNESEYTIDDHTYKLDNYIMCTYLIQMDYDTALKFTYKYNMKLISYKELYYKQDTNIFTRDFKNNISLELANILC